ncbi:tRNA (adenosine(37)-N6)-dimethylallyltransferase MiaA [Croceivirga thetidis]|uniref:tRNA dimethylallyltransferase n=1 Tax=Croceivirga thetidis TaxID=2721623 RepID=A0ABX1GUE8_9FLAO|nr:tRNA (adenosine(37)-N6)-dimethylallyltransferase MiaA [Croceivirga thetidis]NKI32550.1 tRNA (adenosine(37)-N6)-dimethylallyltransferase MiaA [Croceivirga thetidis]
MPSKKKRLIAIVGPTAIGKTALAIKLAEHYQTEIISADSRQFFKEMKIGTAVPSESELASVKHHFIQHKSINESYSVGDFEREALSLLKKLFSKFDNVIMVGGSGLYVDAVTNGLDKFPEVPDAVRLELIKKLDSEGLESLQNELAKKDPEYYQRVDLENPHRLIRALEVCVASGQPYSSFLNQNKVPRNFETIYIGITAEREIIYDRINQRVDQMIKNGLVEEVKKLYPYKKLNALQTVGYKELFQFFDGRVTQQGAVKEIKKNTRRFAKRQLTWYRKKDDMLWVDFQESFVSVHNKLQSKIEHG